MVFTNFGTDGCTKQPGQTTRIHNA